MAVPMSEAPNPGSKEALDQGCLCPVFDNNKGDGLLLEDGAHFWINEYCPVHGNFSLIAQRENRNPSA